MSRSFNQLNPAEAERLAILSEECGEVIQAIGKILRHGYDSTNPDSPTERDNRRDLEKELGDVAAIVNLMSKTQDISHMTTSMYAKQKLHSLKKYTHHQGRWLDD